MCLSVPAYYSFKFLKCQEILKSHLLTTCCCLPPRQPPGEGQARGPPVQPTRPPPEAWRLDPVQPQGQDNNAALVGAFEPIKKTNDCWLIFPPPLLLSPFPPPHSGPFPPRGQSGLWIPSGTTACPPASLPPPKPALGPFKRLMDDRWRVSGLLLELLSVPEMAGWWESRGGTGADGRK